jgi:hypothetical protein
MGRGVSPSLKPPETLKVIPSRLQSGKGDENLSSPRCISTGLLHASLRFHIQPINQVVYLEPYPLKEVGDLILGWASRLDAFSGYPVQT